MAFSIPDTGARDGTRPRGEPAATRLVSGTGLLVGLSFLAASLTPSLVPRDAVVQGVLGGALFAIGYGIAVAAIATWRWLELPEPGRRTGNVAALAAAAVGITLAAIALSRATDWQNSIRTLMALPPLDESSTITIVLVAAGTALLVFVIAWLFRLLFRFAARPVRHVLSARMAALIGLVVAFTAFGLLVNGVLVHYGLKVLDSSYAALDALIDSDTRPPQEPWKSGSSQSLLEWEDLGRAGRRFVDRVIRAEAMAAFWGEPAKEPLRVYVGLNSADEVEERADLALRELQRIGAFDRKILVVAIPTGTGFMEQSAIATLEFLHRGDVATVAMQYSYLQSPFSLIFEPGYGAETARALLRVVYDTWSELPDDARPQLYLQGLSLGALSSEQSLRLYEVLGDPFHGALWSGPPFPSEVHAGATAERNPESPEWLPTFDDGSFIRFASREHPPARHDAHWGPMRIVYLQHASDPIVFFDVSIFWQKPSWLEEPRGPDISPLMRWYPIVTALQIAADMALSNDVPAGHGHQYAPTSYIDAWVELTEPKASAAEIDRLKALFE